jgi:hypothetical protein
VTDDKLATYAEGSLSPSRFSARRRGQLPVECSALHAGSCIDEDLLDARQRLQSLLAADRWFDGYLAPAGNFQS